MDAFAIQRRLKELGFDPGPIDGMIGRLTTAAVAKFQAERKLPIQHPGSIGPITLGALFPDAPAQVPLLVQCPWIDLALSKKGLHEKRNNAELRAFLKSDGHTLGDPAQLPWCGDFIETCLAVTLPNEPLPTNPYLARNWAKWAQSTPPCFGAVGSFWRGSPQSISGHVGFIVGKGPGLLYVLGGNQSDMISIAPISNGRLISARWPSTVSLPATIRLPEMSGGQLSLNEA